MILIRSSEDAPCNVDITVRARAEDFPICARGARGRIEENDRKTWSRDRESGEQRAIGEKKRSRRSLHRVTSISYCSHDGRTCATNGMGARTADERAKCQLPTVRGAARTPRVTTNTCASLPSVTLPIRRCPPAAPPIELLRRGRRARCARTVARALSRTPALSVGGCAESHRHQLAATTWMYIALPYFYLFSFLLPVSSLVLVRYIFLNLSC